MEAALIFIITQVTTGISRFIYDVVIREGAFLVREELILLDLCERGETAISLLINELEEVIATRVRSSVAASSYEVARRVYLRFKASTVL